MSPQEVAATHWFEEAAPKSGTSQLFLSPCPAHIINRTGLPHSGVWECEVCGEVRGRFWQALMLGYGGKITCICDGIRCRYCRKRRVRRPLTDHIGEGEMVTRHTPWFGFLIPCTACQAAGLGPAVVPYEAAS